MKKILMLKMAFIFFLIAVLFNMVLAAPTPYLTETSTTIYNLTGNILNTTGTGYVEVDVGNTADVLQYLRINFSTASSTNLNSTQAYRATAGSVNAGDRTRIFVDTNSSQLDSSYSISNVSNRTALRLTYANLAGGNDLIPSVQNNFTFNITATTTASMSIALFAQAAKNILGNNDSMNITSASATSGTATVQDTDSDSYNDMVNWSGTLNGNLIISFNATITPNINFNETDLTVALNSDYSVNASSNVNTTISGVLLNDTFSRGPIREGVELLYDVLWRVRGYIVNVAQDLNYTLHSWALYRVDDLQNSISSSSPETALTPNQTFYTSIQATNSTKPYYTAAFNWEVVWNAPIYIGSTISRMRLPALYEMDDSLSKSVTTAANTASSRTVNITDSIRNLGQASISINDVLINSTIPRQTTTGTAALWSGSTSSANAFYINSSGTYIITSYANITIVNATSSNDGYIFLNITNISSLLNFSLGQNEDIVLQYILTGTPSTSDQAFDFLSNITVKTISGTPLTRNSSVAKTITGYAAEPTPTPTPTPAPSPGGGGSSAGGGGGGIVAGIAPVLDIVNEFISSKVVKKNLINVEVVDRVQDYGKKGAGDMNILIYLPMDSIFNYSSVIVKTFTSKISKWNELRENDLIISEGTAAIGSTAYKTISIQGKKPWHLYDSDKLSVIYDAEVPYGTHNLLVRMSGYNPYRESRIFEDSYIAIRVEKFINLPLQITESNFQQEEAPKANKPVSWFNIIEVYNPNEVAVEQGFSTHVFNDILNAYMIKNEEKSALELKKDSELFALWHDRFEPSIKQKYTIQVLTPPVMESKRETVILSINDTFVKFLFNATLENTALEDYKNVMYFIPIELEKILSIEIENENSSKNELNAADFVVFGEIKANQTKNIQIIYQEHVPVLKAIVEKPSYICKSKVNLTTLIIMAAKAYGFNLETEVVSENSENIFSSIYPLTNISPGKESIVPQLFSLQPLPPGKYTVISRLRKDFSTILTDTATFDVSCPITRKLSAIWTLAIIASFILFFTRTYWSGRISNIGPAITRFASKRYGIIKNQAKELEARMKKYESREYVHEQQQKFALKEKLEKELGVLEEAHNSKLISDEAFEKSRNKLVELLKGLKK